MADTGKAFWCPDCDGLTYLDPERDTRRMLLFLETRSRDTDGSATDPLMLPGGATGLRKRLSPLRYPGGKSKVIDQIYAALLPGKMETFVELFAGGASLGLSLLDAGKIQRLILNDLDPAVAGFWRCLCDDADGFADYMLRQPEPTRDTFFRASALTAALREGTVTADPMEAAYAFLVVNRLSFGGMQGARPMGGKHGTEETLRSRWNPTALAERIRHIGTLADRITVYSEDAATLLEERIGWLPEATTIFVDPPYVGVGEKLYPLGFSGKHEELAELLNEFYISYPGPDVVITYDDCPEVRDIYPLAEVQMLSTAYSLACRGTNRKVG